jgi:GNAT superfamily N-acetyltransferase
MARPAGTRVATALGACRPTALGSSCRNLSLRRVARCAVPGKRAPTGRWFAYCFTLGSPTPLRTMPIASPSDRFPVPSHKPRLCVLDVRDRTEPDAPPIAWVLVERQEAAHRGGLDGTLREFSIQLHYERILPGHTFGSGNGCFAAHCVQTADGRAVVTLGSTALATEPIFLDLPGLEGHRIGTYLMNEIVAWARRWPQAEVRCADLEEGLAIGENHVRRNRFCEQFGLVFDFNDAERKTGQLRPTRVESLLTVDAWQRNIVAHDARTAFADMLHDIEQGRRNLERSVRSNDALAAELQHARSHPLRWAAAQLWRSTAHACGAVSSACATRLRRSFAP